jgi:hypothetical protein
MIGELSEIQARDSEFGCNREERRDIVGTRDSTQFMGVGQSSFRDVRDVPSLPYLRCPPSAVTTLRSSHPRLAGWLGVIVTGVMASAA